jgi:hypothetical protein
MSLAALGTLGLIGAIWMVCTFGYVLVTGFGT